MPTYVPKDMQIQAIELISDIYIRNPEKGRGKPEFLCYGQGWVMAHFPKVNSTELDVVFMPKAEFEARWGRIEDQTQTASVQVMDARGYALVPIGPNGARVPRVNGS